MAPNPFTLAADGSESLLPLLRANPALASQQDDHGYSLLHALTSYNHISLLRTIVREFNLEPNTVDEDGETALFVAETVEAASCLVEELGVDPARKNLEGETAEEKIRGEGEVVVVSDYLAEVRKRDGAAGEQASTNGVVEDEEQESETRAPPPLPDGVRINIGTMQEEDEQEPDPEFRRRIEELAARDDFTGEEGQAQLRELVRDAVRDVNANDRDVRRRVE